MKKDKDSFDLYLSIKIKECAEDIPVPKHSEDETWLGIKKELEAKKHKQTIIAKRMVNAALSCWYFLWGCMRESPVKRPRPIRSFSTL